MKQTNMLRTMTVLLFGTLSLGSIACADDYVVIAHEGKVYDRPNSKSYATTNQNGDEIVVKEGMVFKKRETREGWDLIEYTPGLSGFILQYLEATPASLKSPAVGTYSVSNQDGKNIVISQEGTTWVAAFEGKKYAGQKHDGAVVFYDADSNIAFSLVNIGGTPVVVNYDNSVTNFF